LSKNPLFLILWEYIKMAESKGSAAQPRLRDVIASLRPQAFWWGSGIGVAVSAVIAAVLFAFGIFSINSSSLVSLDPKKVALEIQFALEEEGVTTTVECPTTIIAPVGFSFECMVTTPEGGFSQADITIGNVLGEIIWSLRYDLGAN
jgi:hypothetical protein